MSFEFLRVEKVLLRDQMSLLLRFDATLLVGDYGVVTFAIVDNALADIE